MKDYVLTFLRIVLFIPACLYYLVKGFICGFVEPENGRTTAEIAKDIVEKDLEKLRSKI